MGKPKKKSLRGVRAPGEILPADLPNPELFFSFRGTAKALLPASAKD